MKKASKKSPKKPLHKMILVQDAVLDIHDESGRHIKVSMAITLTGEIKKIVAADGKLPKNYLKDSIDEQRSLIQDVTRERLGGFAVVLAAITQNRQHPLRPDLEQASLPSARSTAIH